MPSDLQICIYYILSVAPISQRNKGIAQVESNHIFPCYLNSENRNASLPGVLSDELRFFSLLMADLSEGPKDVIVPKTCEYFYSLSEAKI